MCDVTDKRNIVILTGAGISAESGLATFRGPEGLWEGHRVEDVATPQAFRRNPELVQRFYDERRARLAEVAPNAAHVALARLDAAWPGELLIVTQNVDDLHERAGAKRGLTTAAGTIRPARVLVIGAGVAGLQAIATCKRLGAMVEAYDVRSAAREQIESLGAKFVDTGVAADGVGGYARELTAEEKAAQTEKLAKAVALSDVVITTAAIPGKKAPIIITTDMIGRMKYGAIIVDMAAESGGNCALTQPGEHVIANDVNIHGPLNLPSRMPTHASELYAKNLYNFLSPWIKDGELAFDWSDDVVAGTLLCKDGATVHATVKQVMGEA